MYQYFMDIWYFMWSFLYIVSRFVIFFPRKIWQPWSKEVQRMQSGPPAAMNEDPGSNPPRLGGFTRDFSRPFGLHFFPTNGARTFAGMDWRPSSKHFFGGNYFLVCPLENDGAAVSAQWASSVLEDRAAVSSNPAEGRMKSCLREKWTFNETWVARAQLGL
jgi:hypothetical protein